LAAGVAIAGVSPGLAYTPFSEIIATLVSEPRQRSIYSIINSGTSLGVGLSGPVAILLGSQWRLAWLCFAAFGLLSTLWCVAILPRISVRNKPLTFSGLSWRTLTEGLRARLFIVSFLMGIATSIYWTFSVDLVRADGVGTYPLLAFTVTATQFGQIFWTVVGLAGFAGMAASAVVARSGLMPAMRLFLIGIAVSTAIIALSHSIGAVLISGVLFGALFVFAAAALGMWSLEIFQELPALGFGVTFLLLSAGQFVGPVLVGALVGYFKLGELFIASSFLCASLIALLPQRKVGESVAGA
jgi:predicted MFS family arabinose efflux permease